MLAALSAFLLLGTLVLAEEHLLTTVPLLVSLPGLGHQNYLSSWPLPQEPCGRRMLLLSLQETDCEKANMHWALEHPDSFSWIPYVAVASSSSPAKALSISVASACHSTEPLSLKDLTEPDNSMEDVNTLYTSASLTLEDAVAKGYGSTHTLYVTCAHASASNSFLLASVSSLILYLYKDETLI